MSSDNINDLVKTKKQFERDEHTKLYSKYRPSYPQTLIERIIFYLKQKHNGPYNLAVDVGCGTGQATKLFSPYFTHINAYDVSENQIKQARLVQTEANISFNVSSSESLPLADESVDLITVATAAHWFDLEKFYTECKRVLKINGVLAIFTNLIPRIINKNESLEQTLTQLINNYNHILQPYASDRMKYVMNRYKDINPTLEDVERDDSLYIDYMWTIDELIQYLRTYSCFQNYCEINSNNGLLDRIKASILDAFKNENLENIENEKFCVRFDLVLILSRKL